MDDKDITNVMIPLKEIVSLSSSMQTNEVTKFCLDKNLTKYPVFDGKQKITGIFNIKSLIPPLLRGGRTVN